jgi:PRTRC genetic system protein C
MSDTNTPDTTSPTPPSRIFKYNDQTFADPGPAYTPDQIRSHLAAYFPELGQATIAERQREDGVVEITFHKQITTKGSGDATAETRRIDILTAELVQLPVRVDPPLRFAVIGKLHPIAVNRQQELTPPGTLPLAMAPDKQRKQLGIAQVANLGLKLLAEPVAVILAAAERPAGQELKYVTAALMPVAGLGQVQNLGLQPVAGHIGRVAMGRDGLRPRLRRRVLATDGHNRAIAVGRL